MPDQGPGARVGTSAAAATPSIVTGSREQLLHLLAEAMEIEHTLMCSYLYAAFSLRVGAREGLSPTQVKAVARWRKAILGVAIEEMGHLLMVANLTVAVGGRPHFGRPNFPISPGYFPSGVVVRLTGFSLETLDHFIFLERPEHAETKDADAFAQPAYERTQLSGGIMPSAQDYATISHLYEAVRTNLTELQDRYGEAGLFVGDVAGQVGSDLMPVGPFATVDSMAAATAVIDTIIEQGEGARSDSEKSHYKSFMAVRQEFLTFRSKDPGFAPAWPVADNPVLRRPPDPTDKVFIDDPGSAALLDFACATYGLLLRLLVQSFGRHGVAGKRDQKKLVEAAFGLMHVLSEAATALARQPASDAAPGIMAGMSFTMLRSVEPFLRGPVETRLISEQLDVLEQRASRLPAISAKTVEDLEKLKHRYRPRSSSTRRR